MKEQKEQCLELKALQKWSPEGEQKAKLIAVLMEPQRLKILQLLRDGDICVCEIIKFLNLPQNLLSHHLKVLKEAGLLVSTKEGKFVRYARKEAKINELIGYLEELIKK